MWLVIIIAFWLTFFIVGWAAWVKEGIKRNPDGGGVTRGRWFAIFPAIAFFTIYLTTFYLTQPVEKLWTDTETPFQALLIISAILFAVRFTPPTAHAAFWTVTENGEYSMGSSQELTIRREILTPVCITVHNTCLTSWDNYRVTLDFKSGFGVKLEDDSIPSSHTWAWKSSNLKFMDAPCKVQAQVTNALVVGENLIMRFLIKAQNNGRFPMNVNVGVSGRPGDTNIRLFIKVVENEAI